MALDNKDKELTALAYLDAVVCVACFVLALIARSAQRMQAQAATKEALTIASYTIQVQGLPPDATSQQVRHRCTVVFRSWVPADGKNPEIVGVIVGTATEIFLRHARPIPEPDDSPLGIAERGLKGN